jgi:Icc-related predicted phosphoesterase
MKIAVCSDLHLEFGDLFLKNDEGAEVLILSGDILVAADIGRPDPHNIMEGARSNRIRDFMSRCSFQFPHVVYVMGNHEHYNGDFATTATLIREMLAEFPNIHFLDRDCVTIGDTTFIGGTLWTDMNNEDPLTLYHISKMMNDFRIVRNSSRQLQRRVPLYTQDETGKQVVDGYKFKSEASTFSPEDAVYDHRRLMDYLRVVIDDQPDGKFVVVGHHAPSRRSTHPRYQNEQLMNGGYSSSLDEFIEQRPQIKLWTHGHTHEDFDYMVGETRIVCNPRGYINYEPRADNFQLKVVEV